MAPVCFSENKSKPRSKARAEARHRTAARIGRDSALPVLVARCTRPSATKIASALRLQPRLQRGAESSDSHNPAAAKCVEGSGDARFVLAALDWCLRQTREPRARHARTHEHLSPHSAYGMDGMLASCARRPQQGREAHIQWISLAVQFVGRCL